MVLGRTTGSLGGPGGERGGAGSQQVSQIIAEIGGWDRFSVSNPPEHMIAAELERTTRWVMTFAQKVPRVQIVEATAQPVGGDDVLFAIQASIANVGWMPTSTAYASEVLGIAEPVVVEITLTNATMPADIPGRSQGGQTFSSRSLGVLPGARENRPARMNQMFWNAKIVDPSRPASALIVVRSQKGGIARQRLELIGEEGR